MENKRIILLYSKYSQLCSQIVHKVSEYNMRNLPKIQLICIDNKKVRKQILQSKRIQVTVVPTVLTVDVYGNIDTYEGNVSFDLVNDMLRQSNDVSTTSTPPQDTNTPVTESSSQHIPNNLPPSVVVPEGREEIHSPEQVVPNLSNEMKHIEISKTSDINIDDLNNMSVSSTRPGLPLQKTISTERESDQSASVAKAIKNIAQKGTGSILNKARELEKQRNKN